MPRETQRYLYVLSKCCAFAKQLRSPLRSEALRARDVTSVESCFLAGVEDIALELQAVCRSRLHCDLPPHLLSGLRSHGDCRALDLSFLLLPRERECIAEYTYCYINRNGQRPESDPNAVFFLGDNPRNRLTWSAASNAIPTLRRNTGFIWSPFLGRWLLARELFAAMGFPAFPEVQQALGTHCPDYGSPSEGRKLLGNAMHFGVCGTT